MVDIIQIETADDPRIAPYRDIRDRDLARRDGLFVAEGKVVLRAMFAAKRFKPVSVLVLDRKLDGLADLWPAAPVHLPVYSASQSALDEIAGFHLHRGVMALVERRTPEPLDRFLAALPDRCVVPVLVGLANHDNVGAIFRNAAAFDAAGIVLDETSCDPLYRKAIRVSVGAALKMPFSHGLAARDIAASMTRHGFRQYALSPGGAVAPSQIAREGRVALYLGTEGAGLPGELMREMTSVRIPMSRSFDSLNVAAASAIVLSQLFDEDKSS